MSFQAYLDTIREKTGNSPDEFVKLAEKRGYLRADMKAGEIIAWLKSEFNLGRGHAMAIYGILRSAVEVPSTQSERLAEHFKGQRAIWTASYKKILSNAKGFGKEDPSIRVGGSYLSLLRKGKKFAILKVGVDFLDIGIKLNKKALGTGRLKKAGDWNTMVSHRVRLSSPSELDSEVIAWLKAAYDAA
jgi:hypothetical protein